VATTQRGGQAGPLQRGEVEEAQVGVEAFAGYQSDWNKLEGDWDIVYTTAPDVVPIVRSGWRGGGLPLRVGRVGQTFSRPEDGKVQNVIEIEAADPIFNGTKVKFVVEAAYEVRTARSIALTFKSAGIENFEPGDGVRALAAPALLPRGWWNLAILMALNQVRVLA